MYMLFEVVCKSTKSTTEKLCLVSISKIPALTHKPLPQFFFSKEFKGVFLVLSHLYTVTTAKQGDRYSFNKVSTKFKKVLSSSKHEI